MTRGAQRARATAVATSRNARCPCGSGKKYKRCCALKQQRQLSVGGWITLSIVALMLTVGAVVMLTSLDELRSGASAPPGRVWSEEHGHWH